jgi:hypothetical protein
MIDGTSMCGGCRVPIDSKSEFACGRSPIENPATGTRGCVRFEWRPATPQVKTPSLNPLPLTERMKVPRAAHAGASSEIARHEFHRSKPRLLDRTGTAGGDALSGVRQDSLHRARQAGIDFQVFTTPVEFLSDANGWLKAARCVRMELGEPDASGRRRPVPIPGSEFELPLSVAIMAIGTSANPIVQSPPDFRPTRADTFRPTSSPSEHRAEACSRAATL